MINAFNRFEDRLGVARDDSDFSYFFDLISYGESLIKSIAVFIVASLEEDKERTKYKYEYLITRANAIGEFVNILEELIASPDVERIKEDVKNHELKEIMQKSVDGTWQSESVDYLVMVLDIFNVEHEKITGKKSLLKMFSLFVLLRNKTKGHGSPKIKACNEACPYLYKSIITIKNNIFCFKRTWAYLFRSLSGKYRVSYINGSGDNDFELLKKSNDYRLSNGIYCYVNGYQNIKFIYTDSELSDYYFPNGNFRNSIFETISYVTDSRKYEDIKDYLVPYVSLPDSHTSGFKQLDAEGECFTNLPKTSEIYIERDELELELQKILLEHDHYPIISLVGRGGIGKTSLAINVVRKILKTKRYDLIVWFSARDVDLLEEGPKKVKANVLDKKDISLEYFNLVGTPVEKKECIEKFSEQLRQNSIGQALYIFDNFETLINPIEIYEWLNENIRNPNKILITSRTTREFKADYPIEVNGLNETQAKELIQSYSVVIGVDRYINREYIEDLIEESDGHPYIIKIILGELHKSGKASRVTRIVADNEKVLNSLFRRTFINLTPSAQRILLILSCWNTFIPRIAIESLCHIPGKERIAIESAIEELRRTSFIEIYGKGINEVIKLPLSALLFARSELSVSSDKLLVEEDRKYLVEFGAMNKSEIESGAIGKINNKFRIVATRIKDREDLEKELPPLEYIATKYPKAWIYLADIYEEINDFTNAQICLKEFLKDNNNSDEIISAWKHLAFLGKRQHDWKEESSCLLELIKVDGVPFEHISNAATSINSFYAYSAEAGNVEYKKLLIEAVISIFVRRIDEANATDLSKLAWLYLNNNNKVKAKEIAIKGLNLDSDNIYCNKLIKRFARVSDHKEIDT